MVSRENPIAASHRLFSPLKRVRARARAPAHDESILLKIARFRSLIGIDDSSVLLVSLSSLSVVLPSASVAVRWRFFSDESFC